MSPLRKLAVLVVEDNANMTTIVKMVLKSFGVIHLYEATTIDEAIGVVGNYAIDIAFCDFNLGAKDGLDFVRAIRTAPDTPNAYLPIIMLTAYAEQHRVIQARDAGVTEFCVKPFTAIELYRKLVEVVDNPRPFIRTKDFFGPDRRRHENDFGYDGPTAAGAAPESMCRAKVG